MNILPLQKNIDILFFVYSLSRWIIALCENQHYKPEPSDQQTKTGLGDPQGDSVYRDVGSLRLSLELKSYFLRFF